LKKKKKKKLLDGPKDERKSRQSSVDDKEG
jgi:hypothetical protein